MPSRRSTTSSPRSSSSSTRCARRTAARKAAVEVIEGEGDKQKITAKAVKARLKEIGKDPLYADERAALEAYADCSSSRTEAKRTQGRAGDLDKKIDAKYPKLTEAEIKTLVVDDKWMARLSAAVQGELDRVSQTLTGRIRELAETLRHAAAEAHRRSGDARRARGRTPQEDGGRHGSEAPDTSRRRWVSSQRTGMSVQLGNLRAVRN